MTLRTADRQQIRERSSPLSENEKNFSEALRKFTGPFAVWSNASFIYFSAAGKAVIVSGEDCLCESFEASNNGKFGSKAHFLSVVAYEGEDLGKVVLCAPPGAPQPEETLEKLIDLATGELSRIEDEAALLAELSASWESLQAVYDLNVDFNSFQDPTSLLTKITERTTAISSRIQSVLWLEKGENLEPAAAKCSLQLESRDKTLGIIGETYIRKRSAIFNDSEKIEGFRELEPELKHAKRLAIVPLATRLAVYGVLVVWLEIEDFAFDSRTMRLLDTLALQAAMVAENDRLHHESIRNAKLNQEVEIGSKIQQTLLTETPPANLKGIRIAAASISSERIDGDFYDFIEYGEDCFDLVIGDVMGKGIPAALVGAATKNSFLRAVGSLQASENNLRPSTEKIVTFVSRQVTPKLIRFESFVTACYTRFDLRAGEVAFVDCGHTKTIHWRAADGRISLLEGENLPLGFVEDEVFREKTARIAPADILFFYSDGVTETKDPQGELFGDLRLQEFIRQNAGMEPGRLISALLDYLNKFSNVAKFNDDLTCIAVKIGENTEKAQ
jgi:serine phosphatase RsbU (regulator of sigma subunit)